MSRSQYTVAGVAYVLRGWRAALFVFAGMAPGFGNAEAAPPGVPALVTNAIQVLEYPTDRLTPSNPVPAHLRGVMTFVDPRAHYGFMQDETAGIAVFWTNAAPPALAGDLVEIEGRVDPNVYAPVLGRPTFTVLGHGEFPTPIRPSFAELRAGKADCQWVEVTGLVRSATMTSNDFFVLDLAIGTRLLKVSVYTLSHLDPEGWANSRVRVRGVACGSFNNKGQFITAEVLAPSMDQVTVMQRARSDPYSLPVTPLTILGHKSESPPGQRIHIRGIVTLFMPGHALYVRDGTNSIEVRTSEPAGARPGDHLDIVGFYERTDHALVIEDGNFRRLQSGPSPPPMPVTIEDIDSGRFDAELVTVSARLLEWRHGTSDRVLSLQGANKMIFTAHLAGAGKLEELPVGSQVQVTGVCLISVDQNLDVQSFELHLRSPADLVLLKRPPWFTPGRILWVVVALLLLGGVVVGWAGLLQRSNHRLEQRVTERTEELRCSEERFRKLAACLPVAVLERDGAGRCTYVNPRWTEISGRSLEECLQGDVLDAIHPDERTAVVQEWSRAIATGHKWSGEFRLLRAGGETCWVHCLASPTGENLENKGGCVATFEEITQRKEAQAKLDEAHKQLVLSSRLAGMAEVATSVLHNVGNVLTSVNISNSVLSEKVRTSKLPNFIKAAALIQEHAQDLAAFFVSDPRGRQLPGYLVNLAEHLTVEQREMRQELVSLTHNIEHIKEIVSMQQNYGKVSGVVEMLSVASLVEDALRMNLGAMERHRIQVVREYAEVPPIEVDKHKVLQILVNLIRNAKYACDDGGVTDKRIILRVGRNGNQRVNISVIDNGVGIPPENLTRIFGHGFTTRKDGHGFGLHSGSLAAKELGGALHVQSDGHGKGAVFTLELPAHAPNGSRN